MITAAILRQDTDNKLLSKKNNKITGIGSCYITT